jgi:hypothetical protein
MASLGLPFVGPDDADLQAIYVYVEEQRPAIPQFPEIQKLIEDFEAWYQGLTWYDTYVMINNTIAEAARRRDLINAAMHDTIDPSWIPADKVDPAHTGVGTTVLSGPKPPLIPTQYKVAATVGAIAVGTLVVLKKLYII